MYVTTNALGVPAGVFDTHADAYDSVKAHVPEGEGAFEHIFPVTHFFSDRTAAEAAEREEEEERKAFAEMLRALNDEREARLGIIGSLEEGDEDDDR